MNESINKCSLLNRAVEGANMCSYQDNAVHYPSRSLIIVKLNSWNKEIGRLCYNYQSDKQY